MKTITELTPNFTIPDTPRRVGPGFVSLFREMYLHLSKVGGGIWQNSQWAVEMEIDYGIRHNGGGPDARSVTLRSADSRWGTDGTCHLVEWRPCAFGPCSALVTSRSLGDPVKTGKEVFGGTTVCPNQLQFGHTGVGAADTGRLRCPTSVWKKYGNELLFPFHDSDEVYGYARGSAPEAPPTQIDDEGTRLARFFRRPAPSNLAVRQAFYDAYDD